jgi:hypothetical protein
VNRNGEGLFFILGNGYAHPRRPLWVKDGCDQQAGGTAGLPAASEILRAFPHLRFVPIAAMHEFSAR